MSDNRLTLALLRLAPLLLFVVIVVAFGLLNERFLSFGNFRNIVIQAAPIAILAIGMTFVLLIAEIDLSVGAVMYVGASLVAIYLEPATGFGFTDPNLWWPLSLAVFVATGMIVGAVHGLVVTSLGIASFIATLASLFMLRGLAMFLSNTRTLQFSREIKDINRWEIFQIVPMADRAYGVPVAILILLIVFFSGWLVLRHTAFGRQIHAVGEDREAAKKAGLAVKGIVFACFVICGFCAGVGGFVAATQQGAVGPNFGLQVEFQVIAAAVLGGVSLFGGRGSVWGPVFGAILIRTTIAGLTFVNADPYIYPLVTAAIIFLAVAVDGLRTRMIERMSRRMIRPLEAG
ncbi:ABC transporter permease [Taklimakanibacter lacteus]|uniref:ABC transporter permease n=1 Tax=Taklimakanibacter lacteus TaxID=2268456 RepID=UPI000E66B7FB